MKDARERVKELRRLLADWSSAYYAHDESLVSDEQYDACMLELQRLEEQHPELASGDSPTKTVGYAASRAFVKARHRFPMLSLDNVFDLPSLERFLTGVVKNAGASLSFVVEPKIDGLSLSIIYEKGVLVRAVTRGNGQEGEDVTQNVLAIADVPKRIAFSKATVELRGEVFITKDDFVKVNEQLLAEGKEQLANPRNAASGALRQLDPAITRQRRLSAAMYGCPDFGALGMKTQEQIDQYAAAQGFFGIVPLVFTDVNALVKAVGSFDRNSLPFVIDGLVVKVNELDAREGLGYTSRFPKWAIAYKFPSEIAVTKLNAIVPSVGRTGRITYNAVLQPVLLLGTTVSAATLHNADYVREKDIRVNDFVQVYKAGEIIPKVIGPVLAKRTAECLPWKETEICPACGSLLSRPREEVDQYCENAQCPARILESLEHFCTRRAMEIEGMGPSQIKRFYDLGILRTIDQIYDLPAHKAAFLNTKRSGEKSFEKLVASINVSKERSLERLLNGVGIRLIGERSALQLAKTFRDIDALMNAGMQEMTAIHDFGETTAGAVLAFFANPDNRAMIARLKEKGVNTKYLAGTSEIDQTNPMFGKKIVITGTFAMPREQIKRFLEEKMGANVADALSKKTDYLLAGEQAGSKLDKAKELGVPVIGLAETGLLQG